MDQEIKEIKRLAGITEGTPDGSGDPMEQMRQLVSGASQALDAGDAGRVKAILRDLYRLAGGTDEGY